MSLNIYIASGWFSEAQEKARQDILKVVNDIKSCRSIPINIYSPKEEGECQPNVDKKTRSDIFKLNIDKIDWADLVIVNTVEKDLGSIFEAGVTYGFITSFERYLNNSNSKQIIYYCPGLKGNFNLMLAESGIAVATNESQLFNHIYQRSENKYYKSEYKGLIE